MKLDLNKILVCTSYVKQIAEQVEYENLGMLEQCLDELDTKVINLEEENDSN